MRKGREGYSDFYKKHISEIKNKKLSCEECGCKLKGDVSEVAHILPKQRFKSVAICDLNVLYLCCRGSDKSCHNILDDSPLNIVKNMKVYNKIKHRVALMRDKITEKFNWKDIDKYE